jgi:hypothetical protein
VVVDRRGVHGSFSRQATIEAGWQRHSKLPFPLLVGLCGQFEQIVWYATDAQVMLN